MDSQDTMKIFSMTIDYLYRQYLLRRIIICDLDNTLINEKDFLYSAYYAISKSIDINDDRIYKFLKQGFENGYRKDLYQRLNSEFPNINISLEKFLNILHNHRPRKNMKTLRWFQDFIKIINYKFGLYIITNGNPTQQKNKLISTNFPDNVYIKKVVFSNGLIKKPNPISFKILMEDFDLYNPIYIGDSSIDKEFAKNIGIEFINVKLLQ